jgi:hypothetical protein
VRGMVGSAERQHDIPRRKIVKENPRWARESDKAVISATPMQNLASKILQQLQQAKGAIRPAPSYDGSSAVLLQRAEESTGQGQKH